MNLARRFKKDWDGNRKRTTAHRGTKHRLGELNISFKADLEAVNLLGDLNIIGRGKPGTQPIGVLFLQSVTSFLFPVGPNPYVPAESRVNEVSQ